MKRKKVLKLKKGVKTFLIVLAIYVIGTIIIFAALDNYNKEATECDEKLGRTCTLYEINRNK